MTLQQVQALTPSFNWSVYLKAMRLPATEKYLVTSPDFFTRMEKSERLVDVYRRVGIREARAVHRR
jgi:hypothetical protein